MSEYLPYLYRAGHYATTFVLYIIIVLSVGAWATILTGYSVAPSLPVTLVLIGTINLVPILCILPGLFAACMLTFIPSAKRLMKLELSHRSFRTGMEDVRQAFYIAFSADRSGMFRLTEQFDAVSERIRFLKNHDELINKEPEILTLAAQMSFEAKELAARYSTENVARAHNIIAERLHEVEAVETLITNIERTRTDAKRTLERLATIKNTAGERLEVTMQELETLLEPYGFVRQAAPETNVVTMVPAVG